MIIIPAIDLKDGLCVRLLQGREEALTAYSSDPAEVAKRWAGAGADLIHLVDLDGAFSGHQKNLDSVVRIRRAVDVALELGGGVRTLQRVDALMELGIDRVIIGTAALKDPKVVDRACDKHPGRILVGIDAKDGKVAVEGWVEVSDARAGEFARDMQRRGVAGIIYTDIARDGMMTGPNIPALRDMVKTVSIPVIASGGVSSLEDLKRLMTIERLWGAITGKALYEGRIDLAEAVRLTRGSGEARPETGGRALS